MAKKFMELENKMSPESLARSDALYQEILTEMPRRELCEAKVLSQVKLAESLHVNQAVISKMEHGTDMYISTLRDSIRAKGGDLEVIARFADGTVNITSFASLEPIDQPLTLIDS